MTLLELIQRARRLGGLEEAGEPPDVAALTTKLAKKYQGPGPLDGAELPGKNSASKKNTKSRKSPSGKAKKVKPKKPQPPPKGTMSKEPFST